jgi:hypothetical protein
MKLAGFLLLPAGWFLVLSALVLLGPGPARSAFILAGMGVELLGLGLAVKAHLVPPPPPSHGAFGMGHGMGHRHYEDRF